MIVIVIGKSGTGKHAVSAQIIKDNPSNVPWLMYTTRPPRPNEKTGIDYFFVTDDDIKDLYDDGLIVTLQYFTRTDGTFIYATRKIPYYRAKSSDYILFDQNANSARKIKKYYDDLGIKVLVICLRTEETIRRERIISRGGISLKELDRRAQSETGDLQYDENNIADVVDYYYDNNEPEDIKKIADTINNLIVLANKGVV